MDINHSSEQRHSKSLITTFPVTHQLPLNHTHRNPTGTHKIMNYTLPSPHTNLCPTIDTSHLERKNHNHTISCTKSLSPPSYPIINHTDIRITLLQSHTDTPPKKNHSHRAQQMWFCREKQEPSQHRGLMHRARNKRQKAVPHRVLGPGHSTNLAAASSSHPEPASRSRSLASSTWQLPLSTFPTSAHPELLLALASDLQPAGLSLHGRPGLADS